MYRMIFIAVIFLLSLVTVNVSSVNAYDSTDFSAEGRKLQPVPTGHTPGKDNGPGFGFHNAGEDCGICHKPSGKAPNQLFTMSGTLYEDRAGRRPLKDGEVILQDINGKLISMTSNEVGNFWTYEPIGSDPKGVVGKTPPVFKMYTYDAGRNLISKYPNNNAQYSASWTYKTWVKNGDHVLPMVTIAPVGGTGLVNGAPDATSRMSCSMHHAPMGGRGALWASTKATLSSYPASGLSFKKHILPIFKNKCIPCHIPGETWTRIVTKTDIDATNTRVEHSGGIDLTSYDGSNLTIKDSMPGLQPCPSGSTSCVKFTNNSTHWIKKSVSDSVIRGTILPKTDGTTPHAGGKFWSAGNADYEAIKKWITEGGLNN